MALVLARRQQRSREQLAASFEASQRFVPYDFLALLGRENITEVERADSTALELGILFADIRGFTTLCERRSTEENFAFVNRYLERIEPAILGEGGFIHQYLGDGIVALFPGGGAAALRRALRMQRAVRVFNDEIQREGGDAIRIGIGAHDDRVMLGTIGGSAQLDAGVISDGMNLTARIESLTKTYRASVLVSGGVAERAEGEALREIDTVVVKGRSASVVLLQALDALDEIERAAIDETADDYARGLAAYRRGEFEAAREAFERCSADPCAAVMAERSAGFVEALPSSWRGVTHLDHK